MVFLLLASSASSDVSVFLQADQQKFRERRLASATPGHEEENEHLHIVSHRGLHKDWKLSLALYKSHLPKLHFALPSRCSCHSSWNETTWRQRRFVRQAAKAIQAAVTDRLKAAPFLTSLARDDNDNDNNQSENPTLMEQLPIVSRSDIDIRFWLGRGGFCDVFEIEPPIAIAKNDKVVMKHLVSSLLPQNPSFFSTSSKEATRFVLGAVDLRMEALYLSQLSHPNIIELLGVVQPQQGLPYSDGLHDGFALLLEPLSDTLDQRLEAWERQEQTHSSLCKENAHLEKALAYAAQVADALKYLHERRIVMSDVKPSNVGFTKDDTVKLFDFGLCRELPMAHQDDLHRLYTLPVGGTPVYLPPEVLVQRKYNCLADVYSWALMLHQMVSLQKPYNGLARSDHYQRVAIGGERPPLDAIPTALHSLLQHAWDANVAQRWSMAEARQELDLARKELGYSLDKPKPKHSQSVSSNMDSLVYGMAGSLQGNSESSCWHDWEGVASMTGDDFENYFVRNE